MTDEFLKMVMEVAEEEGITIEAVLKRAEKNLTFLSKELEPEGRLKHVEDLFRREGINKTIAAKIIERNHILQPEIKLLAEESKITINKEYGIIIPDYELKFDPEHNPNPIRSGYGITDWFNRSITLPTEGLLGIPLIIVHELAHSYHMENSRIYQLLKPLYDPEIPDKDLNEYREIKEAGHSIIEGWASFLTKQCAILRDKSLGDRLYELIDEEDHGMKQLLDNTHKTDNRRYYNGLAMFSRIFDREGFEGALYAANNLITDMELEDFSN